MPWQALQLIAPLGPLALSAGLTALLVRALALRYQTSQIPNTAARVREPMRLRSIA